MNILIVNQPVGNRGDESAHRAFIKSISKNYPSSKIKVAFFGEPTNSVNQMQVSLKNVVYKDIKCEKGKISLAKVALKYHISFLLVNILPNYRKLNSLIKKADYIICAPGGICMGPFMNWDHIFWLNRAKYYNKPTAYYSRSFGPFEELNNEYKIFKRISLNLLKSFKYLSIRDERTMDLAEHIGICYEKSIDSAFLMDSNIKLPEELKKEIGDDYVVFVPNQLTWQPFFKKANPKIIESFYLKIFELLRKNFPSSRIIMMPQLFEQGDRNDIIFFKRLASISNCKNILVLDDKYNSDVQQTIMKNSKFAIGGRYHSIIFAINNAVPFVSLSYENKMFGLLSILSLENRQIDIRQIINADFNIDNEIKKIDKIINLEGINMNNYKYKAREIAISSFEKFKDIFFSY